MSYVTDLSEDVGGNPGFIPSASERRASEVRASAGIPEPVGANAGTDYQSERDERAKEFVEREMLERQECLKSWENQACDESGCIVAEAPMFTEEQIADIRSHKYATKDSGQRDVFETGCQRDLGEGKGRYDLIPSRPQSRIAGLFERGATKYGANNCRKGMPFSRVLESLERHLYQYKEAGVVDPQGDDREDHLAAVAWNAIILMEYEEAIAVGQLPPELDNRFRYPAPPEGL